MLAHLSYAIIACLVKYEHSSNIDSPRVKTAFEATNV
jgi:hypothetical protein